MWAKSTKYFNGADLNALFYNAHLEAIHSMPKMKLLDTEEDDVIVEFELFSFDQEKIDTIKNMTNSNRKILSNNVSILFYLRYRL